MSKTSISPLEKSLLELALQCEHDNWSQLHDAFKTRVHAYADECEGHVARHLCNELLPLVESGASSKNIDDFEYKTHVLFRLYHEDLDNDSILFLYAILYACYLRTSSFWMVIGKMFRKRIVSILSPVCKLSHDELDLRFMSALIDYICTLDEQRQSRSSDKKSRLCIHKQLRNCILEHLRKRVGQLQEHHA